MARLAEVKDLAVNVHGYKMRICFSPVKRTVLLADWPVLDKRSWEAFLCFLGNLRGTQDCVSQQTVPLLSSWSLRPWGLTGPLTEGVESDDRAASCVCLQQSVCPADDEAFSVSTFGLVL